jgi:glycosyltransferase involved in cell wall biosynthesis
MLGFCDQVVVVDGGSTDGTWEILQKLSSEDDRIIIDQNIRDWDHPRFAVFDGLQKAYARSLCTGEWCWQMDSDEIVHESDYNKVKNLIKQMPKTMHLLALPVIEYWGGSEKVRIDVNPWKWRLSKNLPHITHGIPKGLRKYDDEGRLYAAPGTDGCDYINTENYNEIPCVNFYNQDIHTVRLTALQNDTDHIEAYENWFNNVINQLPGVHHYSWHDLERKIKTYKNYWSKHWQSMYNIEQQDTPENNMFFDKKWKDVTNKEIKELAEKLKDKMGGWIFHNKVNFENPTPHVYIEREEPEIMRGK